jgi:hypothetical protein
VETCWNRGSRHRAAGESDRSEKRMGLILASLGARPFLTLNQHLRASCSQDGTFLIQNLHLAGMDRCRAVRAWVAAPPQIPIFVGAQHAAPSLARAFTPGQRLVEVADNGAVNTATVPGPVWALTAVPASRTPSRITPSFRSKVCRRSMAGQFSAWASVTRAPCG